ncbi:MAG: alpha/beta fold hydrolase [Thermoflexaceae bacterium]|nr:alpha/beta fold hydrolase [Thermoflexaceae bacterium]
MKTATHRGQRIAYDVTGDGPALVFQHGFLSNRQSWHQSGYVAAFADAYRVITVDSLGHGESDKPADPTLYGRAARAGDVAAVLDAEGIEKAHFIGYSMGGWISTAMLLHQPGRLRSLVIGAWDPLRGIASQPSAPNFEALLEIVGASAPALRASLTTQSNAGLSACWDALYELDGVEDALRNPPVPIAFWAGRDDDCFGGVRSAAAATGVQLLEVPGDHLGARGKDSIPALRAFLGRIPG